MNRPGTKGQSHPSKQGPLAGGPGRDRGTGEEFNERRQFARPAAVIAFSSSGSRSPIYETFTGGRNPNLCVREDCGQLRLPGEVECRDCLGYRQSLDKAWAEKQQMYLTDPTYAARQAARDEWIKECLATFLLVLAIEGVASFAFDVLITWRWVAVDLIWALLLAALITTVDSRNKKNERER